MTWRAVFFALFVCVHAATEPARGSLRASPKLFEVATLGAPTKSSSSSQFQRVLQDDVPTALGAGMIAMLAYGLHALFRVPPKTAGSLAEHAHDLTMLSQLRRGHKRRSRAVASALLAVPAVTGASQTAWDVAALGAFVSAMTALYLESSAPFVGAAATAVLLRVSGVARAFDESDFRDRRTLRHWPQLTACVAAGLATAEVLGAKRGLGATALQLARHFLPPAEGDAVAAGTQLDGHAMHLPLIGLGAGVAGLVLAALEQWAPGSRNWPERSAGAAALAGSAVRMARKWRKR